MLEGRQDRAAALARYGAFSAAHRWKFEAMYAAQQSIRHLHGRPLDALARVFTRPRVAQWAFRALPGHRAAVVRRAGASGGGRRVAACRRVANGGIEGVGSAREAGVCHESLAWFESRDAPRANGPAPQCKP